VFSETPGMVGVGKALLRVADYARKVRKAVGRHSALPARIYSNFVPAADCYLISPQAGSAAFSGNKGVKRPEGGKNMVWQRLTFGLSRGDPAWRCFEVC